MPRSAKTAPATNGHAPIAQSPLIEVRPSPIAGLGVFARERIEKGTRLIEYVGEIVDSEEAARRYDDDAMEQHHTFLFAIDDEMAIDGGVGGNDAKYFNHACAPNCEAVIEDGRIFIDTIADVEAGTELVYDYALMREDPWQEHWRELYACRCGAARCRGMILKSPKPPRKKAAKKAPPPKRAAAKRSSRQESARR
jgi:hypothetical protein